MPEQKIMLNLGPDYRVKSFKCGRCSNRYPYPVQTVMEPETYEEICQSCFEKSPYK